MVIFAAIVIGIMSNTEMTYETQSTSHESETTAEQEAVRRDVNSLIDDIAERCPNCDDKMTLEAVEAFCQNCLEKQEKTPLFEVTKPESKLYKIGEQYSFLVHVPLGDVEQRIGEMGSERSGVLMTSLLTEQRQGTFCGEGGLLIGAPDDRAIKGMSRLDCGGEIADGRRDPLEELQEPADNTKYNQIDVKFNGAKVEGVILKVTPDGHELGDPQRNAQLKEIANHHNLPIATIEIAPSEMPRELSLAKRAFSDGNTLTTYDIPNGDNHFLRVDIAHGNFYHSPGINTISRSMIIDRFGQVSQRLSAEQEAKVQEEVESLKRQGSISEEEMQAVIKGFLPKEH